MVSGVHTANPTYPLGPHRGNRNELAVFCPCSGVEHEQGLLAAVAKYEKASL